MPSFSTTDGGAIGLGGAFDNARGYFTQRAGAEVPAANAGSLTALYAGTASDAKRSATVRTRDVG